MVEALGRTVTKLMALVGSGHGQAVKGARAERRPHQATQLADEGLPVSEERYRSLFERVPVGMFRATPAGTIVDVNPAILRLLGYPSRETLMAVDAASLYVDPQARESWTRLLEREGVGLDFESELRRYDGTVVWVRASAQVVRAADGQTAYFEGAVMDITERKKAEEQIRHRVAELEAFYDLSKRLRTARDPEDMHPILLEHAAQALHADVATLAFLTSDRRALIHAHTVGIPPAAHGSIFAVAGTPSGRVVESDAAFVTADYASTANPVWLDAAYYQYLGPVVIVPIRSGHETIGTVGLGRMRGAGRRPFTDAEVRMLEGIVEIGGAAIHRALLNQSLQQAYIQMVLALAQTIESHDSYTAGHSERMVLVADGIAREMGCSDGLIQDIRWGARLHDIGKIGVPDAILNKPGALTEAEWKVMREHPILGEGILSSVERIRGVADLVRHHQERWDGTGYPDGLRGEQIPLGARVLAVVDAYGAITEARPYKPARPHEEAVAEIRRCAGTQFDPQVVDVFLSIIEKVPADG